VLINSVKAHAFPAFNANVKNSFFVQMPDTTKPKADTLRKSVDTLDAGGDENGIETKVDYTADDSIRIEAENKKAYLYGNATVHYEDFDLKAAYIEIDNKTNLITAVGMPDSSGKMQGNPQFKQGKDEMKCEKIIYNVKTKKGKIFGILTKQNDMFIFGEAVKKDTNNVMYIKRMKCIPCEFEDAMIYFRASRAKIIPNDKIVTGPLFLEVSNIPTPLGLPFGFFPNVKKEKSKMGILMPSYGYSATQGFYLNNIGYFIPVSNKLHISLYGSIYGNGSWAIGSANATTPMFEYKVNYKYSGKLNLVLTQNNSGISEDNPRFGATRDANALTKAMNMRITWTHQQDGKYDPTIRFSASVNAGTAGFGRYNNQSATTLLTSTTQSNISFTKMFRTSTLTINVSDAQNLQTHNIQIDAPQLTYAVNRMFPFKNQAHTTQNWLDKLYVDYTLQSKATINTGDTTLFKPNGLKPLQYGLYQRVPIGTNISLLKYFTLSPSATFQQFTNFQTTEQSYVHDTLRTFIRKKPDVAFDQSYQINLTTKLYGDYVFKSKLLKQIRHQIIPTVGFVYHPDMQNSNLGFYKPLNDDSKTATHYYSRFGTGLFGGPAGPESGAITFNINNTLDAKVRQKTDTSITYRKVALLQMLSLGGSYDVAAKQNKLSVINLSARTSFFKNVIGVMFTSAFDPYAAKSDGTRSKTFQFDSTGKLARFTNCNLSVNGNLTNAQIKGLQNSKQPFSIGINYNLQFTKTYSVQPSQALNAPVATSQIISSQNLGATFSFKPTPMWKFDIRSGYDFKLNSISYTQFTIYRDLRCWEARITWVPFGPTKQYMLTLNLKSPSLSTLKIPKQKLWQDNL
jgi:hypothetical protein